MQIKQNVKPLKLAIVAPCYNEEEVLPSSATRLMDTIREMISAQLIATDSFILFVNDGSSDSTLEIISRLNSESSLCKGLDLSRNYGHQNAILAGMSAAIAPPFSADAVVTIDVDLQDPPEGIVEMVRRCIDGADVVYGVRSNRDSDSFFKRFTAESFYKFQKKLGVDTIYNHADFRLMTRRAVEELERYTERNLYLRGIVPMLGYKTSIVEEERAPRTAGETKYTLSKMFTLAFDGITSFSVRPMYFIMTLGIIFLVVALGMAIYVIVSLCNGSTVRGWSSLMLSIWFIGGMILLAIGLVGLYVGKVFIETKQRPRYHINRVLQ